MLEDEELETIVFSEKLWLVLCLNIAAVELVKQSASKRYFSWAFLGEFGLRESPNSVSIF